MENNGAGGGIPPRPGVQPGSCVPGSGIQSRPGMQPGPGAPDGPVLCAAPAAPVGPVFCAAPAGPSFCSVPQAPGLPLGVRCILAACSYGLARLYIAVFLESTLPVSGWPGIRLPLFAALYFIWGEAAFRSRERQTGRRPSAGRRAEAAFWAACTLAVSMALALGRARAGGPWAYVFVHGMAAYWALCRSGQLAAGGTGAWFFWDCLNAVLVTPLSGFFTRLITLGQGIGALLAHRKSARRSFWAALLCLLAALPLLLVTVWLLMQADEGFARLCGVILFQLRFLRLDDSRLLLAALSLPVGAYLFGLIVTSAQRGAPLLAAQAQRAGLEKLRVMPMAAAGLILGAFCAVYALFFAVQAQYLFGAFTGRLPAGFSFSGYARQGFFELCAVMAINLGLLSACARFCARPVRRCRAVRWLCVCLMAMGLLLAVTAFSKLALYIAAMGFTDRRMLSSWAVIVFAAADLLAIGTLVRPCRAVRWWIWFSAASFAALCLLR